MNAEGAGGAGPFSKKAALIPSIPVFFFIFLFFTDIPVHDNDFWWLLRTGQLIVEEKNLPEKDPFAHTSEMRGPSGSGRETFILKQYWLSQGLMYAA